MCKLRAKRLNALVDALAQQGVMPTPLRCRLQLLAVRPASNCRKPNPARRRYK